MDSLDKNYRLLTTTEGGDLDSLRDVFLTRYKYKAVAQTRKIDSEGCISVFVRIHTCNDNEEREATT